MNNGVEYHHIVGEQFSLKTITSMTAKVGAICGLGGSCALDQQYVVYKGLGDGTVPVLSASRFALKIDPKTGQEVRVSLNAPNSTRWYLFALDKDHDEATEHNGMTRNSLVHDLCLYLLGVGPKPDGFDEEFEPSVSKSQKAFATENPEAHPESYYLDIFGVSGIYLFDENNNFSGEGAGLHIDQAAGATYDLISERQTSITLSTDHIYLVGFQAGSGPFMVKLSKGVGNVEPNQSIVFQDVSFPQGTNVKLIVGSQGVSNLLYDSDGNGTFESSLDPTVTLSGQAAKDITPPIVTISAVPHGGMATVSIGVFDLESGVKETRYSVDGIHFSVYTSPFTIDYSTGPITILAFADDNAGNRSGLSSWTISATPSILPVAECIELGPDGYKAWFGYNNQTKGTISIPAGIDNMFFPLPGNKGQTTSFLPGTVSHAFSVRLIPKRIEWRLRGPDGFSRTAIASLNDTPRCQ